MVADNIGFLPDILKVLRALPPKRNAQWQGMCFSATIPPKMQQVLSNVLAKDHVSISTIDASEPPTLAKVPQFAVVIPRIEDTFRAVLSTIEEEIRNTKGDSKIIVFGTTANLVALYAELFVGLTPLNVYALHSRMSQPARTKTTDTFKSVSSGIVFATDVIGRGMDFPDVSLVLQVGLPADADSYTHRVGRTARAGKDGRAILLLTEAESFYLKMNRQFPIQPYPASEKIVNETASSRKIIDALRRMDPKTKQKAYSAYLGFMKVFLNKMQMNAADLVQMANVFALKGMESGEVPEMEKKTIGKMGLKGVPGIRYAQGSADDHSGTKRRAPAQDKAPIAEGPSRRLRHQGIPEPLGTNGSMNSSGGQSRGTNQARGGRASANGGSSMRGGKSSGRGGSGSRGGGGGRSRGSGRGREFNVT